MSNVIPFSNARTEKLLSEQKPMAAEHVQPTEMLAAPEQLRDRMAAITYWLESIQQELDVHQRASMRRN